MQNTQEQLTAIAAAEMANVEWSSYETKQITSAS
jgi:hypothetical protein|nr:MAG TPA: hypothetical protein [Caudoviricetes sp.]